MLTTSVDCGAEIEAFEVPFFERTHVFVVVAVAVDIIIVVVALLLLLCCGHLFLLFRLSG
jgi:hypothetical protein